MMPNTWINEPPVEEIRSPERLQAMCNQFLAEVRRAKRPATESPNLSWWRRLISWSPWGLTEAQMWQERKDLAENGATYIEGFARFGDLQTHVFCVYKPLGKVVGLMFWNHRYRQGEGVVPMLVMLPGRESEGTFLVEYAVKLSERAGYQGRTYFELFNDERLRYEPSWVEYLQSANVVPHDESDEWVKIDGAWRLRKNFRGRTTKPARKVHSPDL